MEIVKKTKQDSIVRVSRMPETDILTVTMENDGVEIMVTNVGCAIMSVRTPDKNGVKQNIVAGLSQPQAYLDNRNYFGCVVGRYANRIAEGRLKLNGRSYQLSLNDPPNHLHGGFSGFSHKVWNLEKLTESPCGAVFSYSSADGEEGYPGNLQITVRYQLHAAGRFELSYEGITDQDTPVNLTNHTYFNLTGFEIPLVLDHRLKLDAAQYTEKSTTNTATGRILEVKDTALDFTSFKRIGDGIDQFPEDMGYDHNFVLDKACADLSVPAAILSDTYSGRIVNVYTDKPGIQVYTANYWDATVKGEQGYIYEKHGAVALETQYWPGSVNHPHFPDSVLQQGKQYRSTTVFEFLAVS